MHNINGVPGYWAGRSALGESVSRNLESTAVAEEIRAAEWGEHFQMRATGGEPYTRVVFSTFANEVRDEFRRLLFRMRPGEKRESIDWKIPIQIELWGDLADVHAGDDLMTRVQLRPDNRFLIRLEVKLHDRIKDEDFRLEALRALLVELALIPYLKDPSTMPLDEVAIPEWLVHGFDQLIEHRRSGSPSMFYRGILSSGQMLTPSDILLVADAGELDPVQLAAFRASSSALIEALLNQPEGNTGIRSFVGELARPNPVAPEVLLRQHFPAFREMDQGLEKWWALEVSSLGQQQSFEFLDREETERFLTYALSLRISPDPPGKGFAEVSKGKFLRIFKSKEAPDASGNEPEPFIGTVEDFPDFIHFADAKDELEDAVDRLHQLEQIGFPLYRPLFKSYRNVLMKLAKGQTRGVEEELKALVETRVKIRDTLVHAEDYLNYFEATRAPARSSAFDDYIRVKRSLEENDLPQRNDQITRYLDALEIEFR